MINLTNNKFDGIVFDIEARHHSIDNMLAVRPGASNEELWSQASKVADWCEENTKGNKFALVGCENLAFVNIVTSMLVMDGWLVFAAEYDGIELVGYRIVGIQPGNIFNARVGDFLSLDGYQHF